MLPLHNIATIFSGGPKVIAEVGAADGLDSLKYAQQYPEAMVYAFEPLEANVAFLMLADSARLRVFPFALGEQNGFAPFWVSGGSPFMHDPPKPWPYSSSLLPPADHRDVHPWCTFTESVVEVRRFDSLGLESPDYVHVDVQGAELAVLRGFGSQLDTVRAVWMEVSNIELYENQPVNRDVAEFMQRRGFNLIVDTVKGQISGDQLWAR